MLSILTLSEEERSSLQEIRQMFPQADPNWVVEQIAEKGKDKQAIVDRERTFLPPLSSRSLDLFVKIRVL